MHLPDVIISRIPLINFEIFFARSQMNLHIVFFREFFITVWAEEFWFIHMGKLDMLIKISLLGETGFATGLSVVANEGSFTGVNSQMVEIFAH